MAVAGNYVAVMASTWSGLSHYYAPTLAPLWLLLVQGLRHLRLLEVNGRAVGRYLVPGVLALQVWTFSAVSGAYAARELNYRTEALQHVAETRVRIEHDLARMPGKHLVMVRHDPERETFFSWTANRADIDAAPVVWAHSLGPIRDERLFGYFRDRRVWWLTHDGREWGLSSGPSGQSASSPSASRSDGGGT